MSTPATSKLPRRADYPDHVSVPDAARLSGMIRYRVARLVQQSPGDYGAVKVTGQRMGEPLVSKRNFACARWLWVVSPEGVERLRRENEELARTKKGA